jgi:hypothetical protein
MYSDFLVMGPMGNSSTSIEEPDFSSDISLSIYLVERLTLLLSYPLPVSCSLSCFQVPFTWCLTWVSLRNCYSLAGLKTTSSYCHTRLACYIANDVMGVPDYSPDHGDPPGDTALLSETARANAA